MITEVPVTEFGCKGHLIVSHDCLWSRHTQIGTTYRVSTLGDYRPRHKWSKGTPPPPETVGCDRFYETMVFKTTNEEDDLNGGCGCLKVADWCDIDSEGYQTAGEAQAGHERMVRKWMKKAQEETDD